jgi:hypothetical protein
LRKTGDFFLVLPVIAPKNKSSNLEKGWKIYFFKRSNFAANQLVSNMEIITFESKAYKELDNKIPLLRITFSTTWKRKVPMRTKFGWTATRSARS